MGRRLSTLVVITGPIGAGKSTVAARLTRRFARDAGLSVANVDLDDVAFMQAGLDDVPELWRRAGLAHVAMVRAWFDSGVDVVVAHGPFFESRSYDELFATATDVHHVLLRIDYDTALARVTADSDRGISKDPGFLRMTHDAFAAIEPTLPSVDLVIETAELTADGVADRIYESTPRSS